MQAVYLHGPVKIWNCNKEPPTQRLICEVTVFLSFYVYRNRWLVTNEGNLRLSKPQRLKNNLASVRCSAILPQHIVCTLYVPCSVAASRRLMVCIYSTLNWYSFNEHHIKLIIMYWWVSMYATPIMSFMCTNLKVMQLQDDVTSSQQCEKPYRHTACMQ